MRANYFSIRDSGLRWNVGMGDEVDDIGTRYIADALCKATEFIGRAFHPDSLVLVHLDEVAELK